MVQSMLKSNNYSLKVCINMNKEKFNFEEALKEIEKIVEALESGKVSLEESLSLYEKGIKLVREANAILTEAKSKLIDVNGAASNE